MKNHLNKIFYYILAVWICFIVFLILPIFLYFNRQENCPDCPQIIWYLFFATMLLLALIAVTTILLYQAEKHRFEEKKRLDENIVTENREKFERTRMKEISEFRQAMEVYGKIQDSLKELTSLLKNNNFNSWPTKEQIEQIVGYMKQHEETFDQVMQKLKNIENDEN